MADELKHVVTLDQEKREKERREREKKEEEEIKKKHEAKLKKKKEREKRIAVKKKKEVRRIRSLVNLPFRILTMICLLFTLVSFTVLYFGNSVELLKSIYFSFLIFISIFLGAGLIMYGIFFLVSQDKIAEMKEMKRLEVERRAQEISFEQEEINQMVEIEKEIAAKKMAAKQIREAQLQNGMPDSPLGLGISEMDYITAAGDSEKLFEPDEIGLDELDAENPTSMDIEGDFDINEVNSNDFTIDDSFLKDTLVNYDERHKFDLD